jgi:molybdopterin converting factor small subunit
MRVKVELLGVLRPADGRWEGPFDLVVRDDVTVGELLSALAERFGRPFRELAEASDGRLPRHVRMFAGSEMLVARDQSVASAAGAADGVSVVFLSPMMGG